jgi:hypothetical protein
MPPQPAEPTFELLRRVVRAWRTIIVALRAREGLGAYTPGGVLATAVWMDRGEIPRRSPYSDVNVMPLLRDLLTADPHLRSCCVDEIRLARALGLLGLDELTQAPEITAAAEGVDERVADYLVDRMYDADYERQAFFRLYNLFLHERQEIRIEAIGAVMRSLAEHEIPRITGESTRTSTLHFAGTGNVFLVCSDATAGGNDVEWWQARWADAVRVVFMLRYVRSDVIDHDYSVMHYSPSWVNDIRKYGIGMWGSPRRNVQAARYSFGESEKRRFDLYLRGAIEFRALLEDMRPHFRRVTATAGDAYEAHHTKDALEDQLIALAIALEALFSPADRQEISFRTSLSAGLLLGTSRAEARDIFTFIQRMYAARSSLVHGGENPFNDPSANRRLTAEHIRRLAEHVRDAIVRMTALYLRGEFDRDRAQVLRAIQDAIFDEEGRAALRDRSDLDRALMEAFSG